MKVSFIILKFSALSHLYKYNSFDKSDSTIKVNDTIEVEMRCIDKNVLRYFTAL